MNGGKAPGILTEFVRCRRVVTVNYRSLYLYEKHCEHLDWGEFRAGLDQH